MKLLAITLTAATLLMAGCTQTDETETLSLPLSFSTTVEDVQTRGTDITTTTLTSMGVFAYFTNGNFTAAATPNFMYNQLISKSGSTWSYSPVKYWPANSTDKISFFAYAPHNATGVAPNAATQTGYPSITYTVPAAEADQTDLLAATPLMNKSNGTVNFSLKHALTKVKFVVKNGDSDGTEKTVNSFSIKAKTSGKLTYTETGFSWGNFSSETTTFTPTTNTNITIPTDLNGTKDIATFYLIPETAGATFSINYTMKGNIETGGTAPTHTVNVTDKAIGTTPAWNAGGAVTYTITLSKTGLEVEATGGTWGKGSSKEMQVFAANELKLGDYYYSDGSWSDGGLRGFNEATGEAVLAEPIPDPVTTNPETSLGRNCIGVIFYLGKHAEDSGNYLNRNNTALGTVKGYVVGLQNTSSGAWGHYSGAMGTDNANSVNSTDLQTSKNKTDFNGYDNTQKIIANAPNWSNGSNYVPLKQIINNGTAASADKTSPWFVPSIGQIAYLYKYKNKIFNPILAKTGGSTLTGVDLAGTTQKGYYGSTESNANNYYYMGWNGGDDGRIISYTKWGRFGSRAILAFTY